MRIYILFKKEVKNKNIELLNKKGFKTSENSSDYVLIEFKNLFFNTISNYFFIENEKFEQYKINLSEIIQFEIQK